MKNILLIIHAFRDLLIRILPSFKKHEGGFAFIVHPRNINDVSRKYAFARHIPKSWLLFFLKHYWPVVISEVTGLHSQKTGKPVKGWIITIPLTAHQMMEDKKLALKKTIQAAQLAKKLGADLIGLGALTASISGGGLYLIDKVDIGITTGHAYTAHIVTSNVFKLTNRFGLNKKDMLVAIMGAAGSVGSTSTKILARSGYNNLLLIDIDRKKDLLMSLVKNLKKDNEQINIEVTHKISTIKNADFIITATNAPEAVVTEEDLKSGAVVIDDAQPSDIAYSVLDRKDVLIIEGGLIHTPGINTHFNFGLKDRFDNFCCLGEVMILASVGFKENFCIGRGATLELVDKIRNLGAALPFTLAEFQNFKECISTEKMEIVEKIIKNRLRK